MDAWTNQSENEDRAPAWLNQVLTEHQDEPAPVSTEDEPQQTYELGFV